MQDKKTLKLNKLDILHNSKKEKVNLENINKILLKNRDIDLDKKSLDIFFNPDFKNLLDPYLMPDMKKAVDRIIKAKKKWERVVVFWDYDVDWVSSTALLSSFLRDMWIKVSYRLPHRSRDGYGLKKYFIDELEDLKVSLIITVDCWTRDIDVIKYSKEKNIDIIITDHHAVPEIIPEEAIAIVNPKRKDNKYPFDKLAWAWVAFKLIQALAKEITNLEKYKKQEKNNSIEKELVMKYMDFASLWTVADCMPLIWENRLITQLWLQQMKYSKSPALIKLTQDLDILNWETIWFQIWPRINACWRLDTPYRALKMLLASEKNIDKILREIEELNNERKEITNTFLEQALSEIDIKKPVIIWYNENISHWIIWLVAGRITEIYNKPCIILTKWDGKMTASCRSPKYFSIVDALTHCEKFMVAYWWHKQAAWFSILEKDFKEFEKTIQKYTWDKTKNIDKLKLLL